jgi:hypothetical protein
MLSMTTLQRQYAANATTLETMLAKAERTGKPVNGFTVDALRERAATYRRLASGRADIEAHLVQTRQLAARRLAELRAIGRDA